MPLAAPVMVRNTEGGPTVLSDLRTKEYVEWQGAGDPSGADVQAVPEEFLQNVNFIRAVQRGILVIENAEDNPEVTEAIERQNKAWAYRREQAQKSAEDSIDQQANNDIVTTDCIAPACSNVVTLKEKQKNERPPLCSTHESMAPQYVPIDDVSGGNAEDSAPRKWNRVTVTARERAQS